MNNTAKQLMEQLGDSTEITIMSDIVYGLNYEYEQLLQENKELKETLKGTTHCYDEEEHQILIEENKVLKTKINNFNLEIDKWLEDSKAEMHEFGDNHEKYWEMFNQLLRKIKNKLVDISDYAVIDREREEELLNKEDILTEIEKWLEEDFKNETEHPTPQIYCNCYSCKIKALEKLKKLKEGKK